MNSKHTPGPWTTDRMFLGDAKDRRSGFVVNGPDADPLPVRICDIRCSPESQMATASANARLIAAAPDMLAALLLAQSTLANITTEQFSRGEDKPAREAIATALKAAGVEVEA